MKRFLNKHGWYLSMVAGIGLLASSVILGKEFFTGQTILAAVLIIFSLVVETATKEI